MSTLFRNLLELVPKPLHRKCEGSKSPTHLLYTLRLFTSTFILSNLSVATSGDVYVLTSINFLKSSRRLRTSFEEIVQTLSERAHPGSHPYIAFITKPRSGGCRAAECFVMKANSHRGVFGKKKLKRMRDRNTLAEFCIVILSR